MAAVGVRVALLLLGCLSGASAALAHGHSREAVHTPGPLEVGKQELSAAVHTIEMAVEKPKETIELVVRQPKENPEFAATRSFLSQMLMQAIFGLIYYVLWVQHYPKLEGIAPTEAATALQKELAPMAVLKTSLPVAVLSCCCPGPRAAHTFHSVGVLDYWPSCILMTMFPSCMLFATETFTDLNEKLGGERDNILKGCLCAFFCTPCVIAQDAECVDLISGAKTGFCGVELDSQPEEKV